MAFAGSFITSGENSSQEVELALAALERNTGASQRWRAGPVDFGCCNDASLYSCGNQFAALFWGRLDNRAELTQQLDEYFANDARILLAAYLKWGFDFLDRVIGEFSCALWDGRNGMLLLGRDFTGQRPLVYHHSPHGLRFATEPRGLLALPGISHEIDEETLAEWFARLPLPHGRSFYKEIRSVPPGHLLIADGKGTRLHRYWRPEEKPLLRLKSDEDYAAALLETLEEAVACRLPAEGAVATTLSSGLDSPTVTALAARQLAKQGRSLIAFTAVPRAGFGESYPSDLCDEGPLAANVARMYPNIDHVLIPSSACPLFSAIEDGVRFSAGPLRAGPNSTWFNAIFEESLKRGAKVLLIGDAGNFTASYDGMRSLARLLAQGKLWALSRKILLLRRAGFSWGGLGRRPFGPFVPHQMQRSIAGIFGKRMAASIYDFSCINPSFASRTGVEERFRRQGWMQNLTDKTDSRCQRLNMLRFINSYGFTNAGILRQYGIVPTDPTADKKVVELCLSIPDEQYLRNGEPRSLIRRAMSGILPDEILCNRRGGVQSADLAMTLMADLPAIRSELSRLDASPLAHRCLDLPRMRKLLDELPEKDWKGPYARMVYLGLIHSMAAGIFLRLNEEGFA